MTSNDKNWAQAYINDPLTAPDPSDETGLNSSLRPDAEASSSVTTTTTPRSEPRRLSKTNPFRQDHGVAKEANVTSTEHIFPSHPTTASPRHSGSSPRNSIGHRQEFLSGGTRPRRSSSLRERFPGDPSVNPLDQLAREKALADRARHTTKKHAIRPDTIDGLDASGLGIAYHHEGPYDATMFARNNEHKSSPVAAVAGQNNEALRATPHEKILDAVRHHHPLDGVAAYPPGETDRNGQTYNYREGENMMTEENAGGGPYKRWAGVQYHPDDIKGKGEPSYSIEKALKDHRLDEKEGPEGMEMRSNYSHNRNNSGSGAYRTEAFSGDAEPRRRTSLSNKIRQRVGSLSRRNKDD